MANECRKRVRRRGFGQAERAAQPRHRQLHDARRQRAALGADEQRAVVGQVVRTKRDISGDELLDLRQHRHHARLAALAGDGDRVAGGESARVSPSASEMRKPQP